MRKTGRATLKDVAAHVGVHYSTVSRALDPATAHLITEAVRSRIQIAVAEMNYRHNAAAVSLRTRTSKTIGIIVPDIANSLFGPIIKGIDSISSAHGFVALIGDTDHRPEKERTLIEAFLSRSIEGLIVASAQREDEAIVKVSQDGTPIVTVNRSVDSDLVSSVGYNARPGIGALVKHLVGLGHRRIAFVSGPQSSSTANERLSAYRTWVQSSGADVDENLIVHGEEYSQEEGVRCTRRLLAAGTSFSAIMGGNDLLAFGIIEELQRHGLNCPQDVSVTGFNDIPMARHWTPPLTTVQVDPFEAGRVAAEILYADMLLQPKQRSPRHVLLPARLVVRDSTARPRAK